MCNLLNCWVAEFLVSWIATSLNRWVAEFLVSCISASLNRWHSESWISVIRNRGTTESVREYMCVCVHWAGACACLYQALNPDFWIAGILLLQSSRHSTSQTYSEWLICLISWIAEYLSSSFPELLHRWIVDIQNPESLSFGIVEALRVCVSTCVRVCVCALHEHVCTCVCLFVSCLESLVVMLQLLTLWIVSTTLYTYRYIDI